LSPQFYLKCHLIWLTVQIVDNISHSGRISRACVGAVYLLGAGKCSGIRFDPPFSSCITTHGYSKEKWRDIVTERTNKSRSYSEYFLWQKSQVSQDLKKNRNLVRVR